MSTKSLERQSGSRQRLSWYSAVLHYSYLPVSRVFQVQNERRQIYQQQPAMPVAGGILLSQVVQDGGQVWLLGFTCPVCSIEPHPRGYARAGIEVQLHVSWLQEQNPDTVLHTVYPTSLKQGWQEPCVTTYLLIYNVWQPGWLTCSLKSGLLFDPKICPEPTGNSITYLKSSLTSLFLIFPSI